MADAWTRPHRASALALAVRPPEPEADLAPEPVEPEKLEPLPPAPLTFHCFAATISWSCPVKPGDWASHRRVTLARTARNSAIISTTAKPLLARSWRGSGAAR